MKLIEYKNIHLFITESDDDKSVLQSFEVPYWHDAIYQGETKEHLAALIGRLGANDPDGQPIFEAVTIDSPMSSG